MASRTQNAKKNITSGILSRMVMLFLPFLTRTCIIYTLGTMYLGLNSLFTSILQILSLAELGFGEAMVFSMYEPIAKKDTEKIRSILALYRRIYRIIGCIVFVVGIVILPFLDYFINGGYPKDINVQILYLVYLLNTVLSYWLFAYKGSLLSANQRLSVLNNINTLIQVITSVVQMAIILLFKNYYLYVVVIPLFTIIRNIATSIVCKKMYPEYYCKGKLEKSEIREIEKRVAGLFIYKLCGTFRSSFDSIIISTFLGLVVLAKYENYYFIANSVIGMLNIISSGITAGVGNSMVSESKEKNYQDFFKFYFMYEWLAGWCTVCLFCLYQPFMEIWVGKDLMMGSSTVVLMCIYFFLLKAGDICYVYRQAAGIWWRDKYRPIIEAVANLVLNLFFVKWLGVVGVLLATIVTMLSINLVWGGKVLFEDYFDRKGTQYYKKIAIYTLGTLCATVVTYTLCGFLPQTGIFIFLCKIIICCIVPNIVFLLLYGRTQEFKMCLHMVRRMVLK